MRGARIEGDAVRLGEGFAASFHRTLRVPESGGPYPLPPGFGSFPILPVSALGERLPPAWREDTLGLVPMRRREALWIAFRAGRERPCAAIVQAGRVNALTGEIEGGPPRLRQPQNYVVAPPQLWLDGVKTASGRVRQFVAVAAGGGASVESQIAGGDEIGGVLIAAFEARPGRIPQAAPAAPPGPARFARPQEQALGAGGEIGQKVHPDPHGFDVWEESCAGAARIRLVDARLLAALAGGAPPPSPIDAEAYARAGLPWFALYEEEAGDLSPAEALARLQPAGAAEGEPADESIEVDPAAVRRIGGQHKGKGQP
jgi:hypothetical protein